MRIGLADRFDSCQAERALAVCLAFRCLPPGSDNGDRHTGKASTFFRFSSFIMFAVKIPGSAYSTR